MQDPASFRLHSSQNLVEYDQVLQDTTNADLKEEVSRLGKNLKELLVTILARQSLSARIGRRGNKTPRCLEWVKGVEWAPFSKRRSLSHEHKEFVC